MYFFVFNIISPWGIPAKIFWENLVPWKDLLLINLMPDNAEYMSNNRKNTWKEEAIKEKYGVIHRPPNIQKLKYHSQIILFSKCSMWPISMKGGEVPFEKLLAQKKKKLK